MVKLICKECGKTYAHKGSLYRHINTIHKDNRGYECNECGRTYLYKPNLLYHISSRHTCEEEGVNKDCFECAKCSKKYHVKQSLKDHIFAKHMQNDSENDTNGFFVCHVCGRKYLHKKNLRWHIFSKHMNSDANRNKKPNGRRNFTCVLCSESLPSEFDILHHFENSHDLQIIREHHSFDSKQEFDKWKINVEKHQRCTYRKCKQYTSKNTDKTTEIYRCNRSGFHTPVQSRKRKLKMQGSKKINGYCSSKITVTYVTGDDFRNIMFVRNHVGHPDDYTQLAHMRYSPEEKNTIIKKLVSGIPVSRIIEDMVPSSSGSKPKDSLEKIDLLNEQDIYNIAASCGMSIKHPDHFHSNEDGIEAWITQNKESVCLYKRQNEDDQSNFGLHRDDFILIIMKNEQIQKFKQYSSNMILVEGMHGIRRHADFFLHTIQVVDKYGEGYPTCFLITNRNDTLVIDVMFYCIREKFGSVRTEVLMSDMQDMYFNSWIHIMGTHTLHHLYCTWHVTHAWQKNYAKVQSLEKKEAVKQRVLKLLYEDNVTSFQCLLEEFLNEDDEDLQAFIEYFRDTYGSNFKKWAYCYRPHIGFNTNMLTEHFHRIFKYLYAKESTIQHVQNILILLDKFLDKKERTEIRADVMGGKLNSKIQAMRRDHAKATQYLNSCKIIPIGDGKLWRITLSRGDDETEELKSYILEKVKDECLHCPMLCDDCQFCFHQFTCSCLQNVIKSIMCKHIHLLCMIEMQDIVPIYGDEIHAEIDRYSPDITVVEVPVISVI